MTGKETIILDVDDNDVRYPCGCSFWRENPEPGTEQFVAQWCKHHAPAGALDDD